MFRRMLAFALGGCLMGTAQAQPAKEPLPVGAPMFYCAGNDVSWQPIVPPNMKALTPEEVARAAAKRAGIAGGAGLTSLEPYVKWWLCEPEPGKWDFSYYDTQARACKEAGLRWVPFLIAGPAYATPPWFKASPESLLARCLEHDQETKTQSIWNPALRPRVEEFLRRFAAHFDVEGIESVLLGISGDFGESIYTAGGNTWTYLNDPYHVHGGYWCGDARARADFREKMRGRYGTVERLNIAWGTKHASFDEVQPFLPQAAPNRRARLDLQRWYCAAMTDWADFWLAATRRAFPRSRILLCTGGSGGSVLGADFSAQAEVAARHQAGIRITNEASDYATNYMLTRHVATACRFYGTHFGFEPAGNVTEKGIVARVYNATASGADELFTYDPEPANERAATYAAWRRFLVKRQPLVDVGLFLNRTSQDLDLLPGWGGAGHSLRAVTDFEIVDEHLIAAGILRRLRVLFWAGGPVVEAETARALDAWVHDGGLLIVSGVECLETVEGDAAPARALLPPKALEPPPARDGARIDVGTPAGDRALRGKWQDPERGQFPAPDTSFRWSSDGAEIELPVPQGERATVVVDLIANGPNVRQQTLSVEGRVVAHVPAAGRNLGRFVLGPEALAGKKTVRLAFTGPTWQPAAQAPGDTRRLGVAVASVAIAAGDVSTEEVLRRAGAPGLTGLTPERIAREYARRLGKGAVLFLPDGDLPLADLARAVVTQPALFVAGAHAPYPSLEGDTAGLYLTRFQDGRLLLLNFTDEEKQVRYAGAAIAVPARGIAEGVAGALVAH